MVSLTASNSNTRQSVADLTTDTRTTTGDVPPSLVGASTTLLDDYIYVFGGRVASTRQMTNHLYILHLPTLSWVRHIAPPDSAIPPVPRYFHSASMYKNRYIVIFGGMGNASGRRPRQPKPEAEEKLVAMDDVVMFDIETMSWVEINVSPSIFTPQARYAHLSTVWDSDKLIVMGGQDIANQHINEINIFDLTECAWIHGGPINGPYDAYRAVAFCPTVRENTSSCGGKGLPPFWKANTEQLESDQPPACIYSNYNFNDLTRELQSFYPMRSSHTVDFNDHASEMSGSILPPGLRFPTGYLMGQYFVVSGTFMNANQRGFQIWALNLTNLTWSHVDTGSILSNGSWNRGLLSKQKYYVLGHSQRDLKDDYSYRRINFDHIAIVDLEAYGIYSSPASTCSPVAQELGLAMLNEPGLSDMNIWTTDQQSIPANSVILAERWPDFSQLLQDHKTVDARSENTTHTEPYKKQLLFPETYAVTLAFLQYLYTDHLITAQQYQPHILSKLLVLADMYNLERLRQLATFALHQLLTISTASMVYETATLTSQTALQVRALRIMMNAKRLLLNQQQHQTQPYHHHIKDTPLPPAPHTMGLLSPSNSNMAPMQHDHHHHQAPPTPDWSTLPISPSSSITVPGSSTGSYYSSSDEPMSPMSFPSSPAGGYSNLRRLAQPGMSPSSSEKVQQRYMYPSSPSTGSFKGSIKKPAYFDNMGSRSLATFQ
jgi:hypothetical protein